MGTQGYCVPIGSEVPGWEYTGELPLHFKQEVEARGEEWVCRSYWSMYTAALYTCTSVSAVLASPGNSAEQMTAIVLMLFGTTLWAQVRRAIGTVAA